MLSRGDGFLTHSILIEEKGGMIIESLSTLQKNQRNSAPLLHRAPCAVAWETCLVSPLTSGSRNCAAFFRLPSMVVGFDESNIVDRYEILLWGSAIYPIHTWIFLEIWSHLTSLHRWTFTLLGWCSLTANLRFQWNVYLRFHFLWEVVSEN